MPGLLPPDVAASVSKIEQLGGPSALAAHHWTTTQERLEYIGGVANSPLLAESPSEARARRRAERRDKLAAASQRRGENAAAAGTGSSGAIAARGTAAKALASARRDARAAAKAAAAERQRSKIRANLEAAHEQRQQHTLAMQSLGAAERRAGERALQQRPP